MYYTSRGLRLLPYYPNIMNIVVFGLNSSQGRGGNFEYFKVTDIDGLLYNHIPLIHDIYRGYIMGGIVYDFYP